MSNNKFIDRLKKLSEAKNGESSQIYEIGKAIRCINPEHEDKNPSMIIKNDCAICLSCGYTIPNTENSKPYKSKISDLILKRAIELCSQESVKDFIQERKYNPEIIKNLKIGYFSYDIYNKLILEYGIENLSKAGLIKNKKYSFVNKIIFPITDFYFSVKPSVVSLKGKKLPYVIEGKDICIVCEGETDAIALHHLYPEYRVIALRGVQSQSILKEINEEEVWICFDNDEAGQKGIHEASKKLKNKKVKLVTFDNKFKDIDDVWKEYLDDSIKHIEIKEYKIKDVYIDPNFKSITKNEYKNIIESNFKGLWETVDLCLSVICVNKLLDFSNPVNVNLVGAPSSQKTTILSMFYDIEDIILKSDNFTPKAFVSHSVTVAKEELEDIDLLPKIRNKTFLTPELAPIFAKRKEDLVEVIGILTRVFDGEGLETDSGAQGHRGYTGEYLFTMLGATTPLSKTAWNIMGRMGSRMFFYQVNFDKPKINELKDIISNGKSFGDKLKICKSATERIVKTIFQNGYKRDIEWNSDKNDDKASEVIVYCAKLLCRLRAAIQVWEDDSENKIYHERPLIEEPYRIVSIFSNIAKGHAISEGRNFISLDDIRHIPHICFSTMPEDRLHAFKALLSNYKNNWTIKEISEIMDVSEKVARKTIRTLEVLKIVNIFERYEQVNKNGVYKTCVKFTDEVLDWLNHINSAFPIFDSVYTQSEFPIEAKPPKIKNSIKNTKTDVLHTVTESGKALDVFDESYDELIKETGLDKVLISDLDKKLDGLVDTFLDNKKKSGEYFEINPGYIKRLD